MLTKEEYMEWVQLTYLDKEQYNNIERLKELNKMMIKDFPFLLPRNRWTDKIFDDYDYGYNEWSSLELGWQINFGWQLLNELNVLVKKMAHPEEFRIEQIKEKFGELRLYCNGNEEIWKLIDKYTELSRTVCIHCGKPATVATTGWFSFYCDDCAKKLKLKNITPINKFESWWNGEDNYEQSNI